MSRQQSITLKDHCRPYLDAMKSFRLCEHVELHQLTNEPNCLQLGLYVDLIFLPNLHITSHTLQGYCPFVKIKFKDSSMTFKDHTKDI